MRFETVVTEYAPPPEHLLTAVEVADFLNVHVNTVKRMKALPFHRLSARGDRRYRMADIETYLASVRTT